MVTAWNGLTPIGVFPTGVSCGYGGDNERADGKGLNPKCFMDAFVEELLSLLN